MEAAIHYPPSAGSSAGASHSISHVPRTSNETTSSRTTISFNNFSRSILKCLSITSRSRTTKGQLVAHQALRPRHKEARPHTTSTISSDKMHVKTSIEAEPYSWPHDGIFNPNTTALVIIDMQNDFCSQDGYIAFQGYSIDSFIAIIPRIEKLLSTFKQHGFPIYWTREGHRPDLSTLSSRELHRSKNNPSGKGIGDNGPLGRLLIRGQPGHQIINELKPSKEDEENCVIDKPGRSAFQHTDFGLMLRIRGIKNLVLCGVTTDVCVHSTMREANDNAFDCLLVEDATAASEKHLHEAAIASVKEEGGIFGAISTTERILRALRGESNWLGVGSGVGWRD